MKESFLLIPEDLLTQIAEKQDKILALLQKDSEGLHRDFITETQAKELFKRKSTWFWQMRKNGVLLFSKIGKSIYYSTADLKKVLFDSRTNSAIPKK